MPAKVVDVNNCLLNNKYVTKYVEPNFLKDTQEGFLKLGTLLEYRTNELSSNRFADSHEGRRSIKVQGNVRGGRVRFGNHIYDDATFVSEGSPTSVHYDQWFNACLFCSTAGSYSKTHHDDFLNSGNEDATEFVVFKLSKLTSGLEKLFSTVYPNTPILIFVGEVAYADEKDLNVSPDAADNDHGYLREEDFLRTCLTKPKKFQHENEIRILITQPRSPTIGSNPIYTKNFSLFTCLDLISKSVVSQ